MPPLKLVKAELAEWLEGLDYIDVVGAFYHGFEHLPFRQYQPTGFSAEIRAVPKYPQVRGKSLKIPPYPILLPEPMRATRGVEHVREAVEKKAERYRNLEAPLVVAVNVGGFGAHADEVAQALFGTVRYRVLVSRDESSDCHTLAPFRDGDGALLGFGGPQYRNVSAVLVISDMGPWNVDCKVPMLFHNPWATHPLTDAAFQIFRQFNVREGELVETPGITLGRLFGLPADWPGPSGVPRPLAR